VGRLGTLGGCTSSLLEVELGGRLGNGGGTMPCARERGLGTFVPPLSRSVRKRRDQCTYLANLSALASSSALVGATAAWPASRVPGSGIVLVKAFFWSKWSVLRGEPRAQPERGLPLDASELGETRHGAH
jgi:hypothetical protein